MSSAAKAIILWIIAMVIPFQGMAATVFPLCPPTHHSTALNLPADAARHHAEPNEATATPMHHHAVPDPLSAHGQQQGESEPLGHGALNCCSAICAFAVMMQTSIAAHAPARSPEPLHPAEPADLGVTLDGFDRPPKHILA